ncbi:cyanophycinase [Actinoallomurus sp. NBC_01490]|uniref:cyanophycinase n=1 Tax=Actinoallomurus sp. NBC_01490 TaxID=2903557 RepID=UPI002E35A349|nr:cyanophycinase [Actinoallomurus sp. NBC_01490]
MKRLVMLSAATVLAAMMTTTPTSGATAKAVSAAPRAAHHGTLILVGGALSDGNAEIYRRIVQASGGARARIGVITAASVPPSQDPLAGRAGAANSVANGRFYVDILRRYGAGSVRWIPVDLDHPGAADSREVAAEAASMTGFVFGGGDQYRLVTTLLHGAAHTDTRLMATIRARYAQGALVAGTSAGAQIQSGPDMVTGGASYEALRDGSRAGYFRDDSVLADLPAGGFGFFTDGLIDTHFSAYGRLGRAVRLAADTGHRRVFGLDPDTALEVTPAGGGGHTLRVLGRHGVSVLDLRGAKVGSRAGHWSISGVRWSYLTDGTVYDPARWTVRMPSGAVPLAAADHAAVSPVEDVFDAEASDQGRFGLTGAAVDLAEAARSVTVVGHSAQSAPVYAVVLRKAGGFAAYRIGTAVAFVGLTVEMYALPGSAPAGR